MAKVLTPAERALAQLVEGMLREKGVQPDLAEGLAKGGVGLGSESIKTQRALKRTLDTRVKSTQKRALNGWQQFVKSKKNKYKYKSGARKGQINMKAMSRAFKKTPAGKRVKKK